jgi:hypothetical protein
MSDKLQAARAEMERARKESDAASLRRWEAEAAFRSAEFMDGKR